MAFFAPFAPRRIRQALLASLALCLPLLPQAARADCSASPELQASMFCASDSLSQAWSDLETRFAALLEAHPDVAEALSMDQALFLALMHKTHEDVQAEHPKADVPDVLLIGLEERMAFLDALDLTREAGLAGHWENAAGAVLITTEAEGIAKVQLSVMEPIMGLNTCALEGTGKIAGTLLTIELPPQGMEELSLSRAGEAPLLGVDLSRSGRPATTPQTCMDSPAVTGWYFPVTRAQ